MESNNKENKRKKSYNEINEVSMNNIKKILDGVISGYLEQFTKKFENFMGQMRIADILWKTFEYRYDKIQGKIVNVYYLMIIKNILFLIKDVKIFQNLK